MTLCRHCALAREGMQHRVVAVLIVALALVTGAGWTGESWGQGKTARVGILAAGVKAHRSYLPFRNTLAQYGWIEGGNLSIEYREARGDPPQFSEVAAELVRLKVDVIYAANAPALHAAYAATRSIPIVGLDFTNDPIAAGYAKSYGRPGGNVTGVFLDAPEFSGKWLELLTALVPRLTRVAVIWDPNPGTAHLRGVQNVARALNVKLQVLEVRKPDDIDRGFAKLRGHPQALIILPSPQTFELSSRIADLAMKHRLPGISMAAQFAEAGGILSYGPELASADERSAALVAKILGGEKPGDLPVERPTKYQLVVNLKAAKVLGITIPQSILLRVDQVIQ
jgi:putative ABC transport system substrate-binding protein